MERPDLVDADHLPERLDHLQVGVRSVPRRVARRRAARRRTRARLPASRLRRGRGGGTRGRLRRRAPAASSRCGPGWAGASLTRPALIRDAPPARPALRSRPRPRFRRRRRIGRGTAPRARGTRPPHAAATPARRARSDRGRLPSAPQPRLPSRSTRIVRVGNEPTDRGEVQLEHGLDAEATTCALVGDRRVEVPVGDDRRAALERRTDHLLDVLRARRRVERGLGPRRDVVAVEDEIAHRLTERCAAGLAGEDDLDAFGDQRVGKQPRLRCLPRPVDPFEGHEHRPVR